MSHQELAIIFKNTAVSIKSNCTRNLSYEDICRAIYGRLYYALYHRYLEHDSFLASSTAPSKHSTMINTIRDNHSDKTLRLYKKMQSLRIWADYEPTVHAPPGARDALLRIELLLLEINAVVTKTTFN